MSKIHFVYVGPAFAHEHRNVNKIFSYIQPASKIVKKRRILVGMAMVEGANRSVRVSHRRR